ncbi:mediator of RNA polymerase II transcription subunit 27 isoform X3, partial [Tachysurus ichikawai]
LLEEVPDPRLPTIPSGPSHHRCASVSQPFSVTLGKVLKAIVVMRSLFIDRTIVRGYHENVYSEDGKVPHFVTTPHPIISSVQFQHQNTAGLESRSSGELLSFLLAKLFS